MKYMEDDVQFMKRNMEEFVDDVVPVSTHDNTLSEEEKEKRFDEFVKKLTQKCGLNSDIETLLSLARMEHYRMSLDFK